MLVEDIWYKFKEKIVIYKNFSQISHSLTSQINSIPECSQNETFSSDVTRKCNIIVDTTGLARGPCCDSWPTAGIADLPGQGACPAQEALCANQCHRWNMSSRAGLWV